MEIYIFDLPENPKCGNIDGCSFLVPNIFTETMTFYASFFINEILQEEKCKWIFFKEPSNHITLKYWT